MFTLNIAFPETGILFNENPQKITLAHFYICGLVKGPFRLLGLKAPAERPTGHLPENWRYPKLRQNMGEIWSQKLGRVDPKKRGLCVEGYV